MKRTNGIFIVSIFMLLALSFSAFAIPLTLTVAAPANASSNIVDIDYALLKVTVGNTNAGAGNNLTNVSFYTSSGVLIGQALNVVPNANATYNWTGLSDGAHNWFANATSGNGTGTTASPYTFYTSSTPPNVCFANASGTTLIVIAMIPVFLALFVGMMFLEAAGLSAIIGAIIVAAFVLPLLASFC